MTLYKQEIPACSGQQVRDSHGVKFSVWYASAHPEITAGLLAWVPTPWVLLAVWVSFEFCVLKVIP